MLVLGIYGGGTVGGGVYAILASKRAHFCSLGVDIRVKTVSTSLASYNHDGRPQCVYIYFSLTCQICVRDSSKSRDFIVNLDETRVTTNIDGIFVGVFLH
jgi:hypothetical protein